MSVRIAAMIWLGLASIANSAHASIIYSSFFAPPLGYGLSSGAPVFGTDFPPVGEGQYTAAFFQPIADCQLDSVTLAFALYSFGGNAVVTDSFDFSLCVDNGNLPGAVVEKWQSVQAGAEFGQPNTIELDSLLRPNLMANQIYWIVAQPATPNSSGAWYLSGGIDGTNDSSYDRGETWFVDHTAYLGFEVDGTTSVPESRSALIAAPFGLFFLRRTRVLHG